MFARRAQYAVTMATVSVNLCYRTKLCSASAQYSKYYPLPQASHERWKFNSCMLFMINTISCTQFNQSYLWIVGYKFHGVPPVLVDDLEKSAFFRHLGHDIWRTEYRLQIKPTRLNLWSLISNHQKMMICDNTCEVS